MLVQCPLHTLACLRHRDGRDILRQIVQLSLADPELDLSVADIAHPFDRDSHQAGPWRLRAGDQPQDVDLVGLRDDLFEVADHLTGAGDWHPWAYGVQLDVLDRYGHWPGAIDSARSA